MRTLATLCFGLGHLGGTILLTGLLAVSSVFGFAGKGCYGRCGDSLEWYDNVNSWQWDAIGLFGAGAGVAGLVALLAGTTARRLWPAYLALGIQAALLAPAVALLFDGDEYNRPQLILGCLATIGAGGGFVYLQGRRRARTR